MAEPFLLSRVLLRFRKNAEKLLGNLSAVALSPDGSLWLGSDELSEVGSQKLNTVDRLSLVAPYVFGDHQTFALREFIDVADELGEVDIESLDCAGSYLWLTGSHSTKRESPKGKDREDDVQRLATVKVDPNRYFIARIPLVAGQLHRSCPDPDHPGRQLTAACLKQKKQGNQLMKALQTDPHLGSYIAAGLPSKENGFDVEGLAVAQNRLFLGLRGPVLRGWAMLLELEIEETNKGNLRLKPIGKSEQRYRKHFLPLDGLGVRDLCLRGDDLLILAGPTMDLAGALRVYCWSDALHHLTDTVCGSDKLKLLFELPYCATGDKAEGLMLFSALGGIDSLLVVYDSPHPQRMLGTDSVFADVFRLPL